ncbi:MAG: hypothetical protein U0P45_08020 [Acidimicrobiales bacterium]
MLGQVHEVGAQLAAQPGGRGAPVARRPVGEVGDRGPDHQHRHQHGQAAGRVQQGGHDRGAEPDRERRADGPEHPEEQVLEPVDVVDHPGEEVTSRPAGEAGRREPGEAADHGGPQVGEQPEGGVVGGEPLGVAEEPLADGEGPHGHRGHRQVREGRVLGGPDDEPGSGGGQADRAGVGEDAERPGAEQPPALGPGGAEQPAQGAPAVLGEVGAHLGGPARDRVGHRGRVGVEVDRCRARGERWGFAADGGQVDDPVREALDLGVVGGDQHAGAARAQVGHGARTRSARSGSSCAVGSSSSRKRTVPRRAATMARASATRRRSPPESSPGCWSARGTRSRSSSARCTWSATAASSPTWPRATDART